MLTLEELKKDRELVDSVDWEMTPEEAVRLYLEWGNNYIWRIRGLNPQGTPHEWQESHYFNIRSIPFDTQSIETITYDSSQYCDGLTLIDNWENTEEPRSFCVPLQHSDENLFSEIRKTEFDYFKVNSRKW